MKVIFMGTPDFAVPTLQKLLKSEHTVSAVFTQPPKPKGRGLSETQSPIHKLALQNSIPVYTPKTLRNEEVCNLINKIEADIIVVVAYGFIIPKTILESKKYGCLNIHPSALPRFRGAAPLQRTIIAGDKMTKICIMHMDEGLDTGDILLANEIDIAPRMTLTELHDLCSEKGADLLVWCLSNFNDLKRHKQIEDGVVYAHKLTKEEGIIDWKESAFSIDCKVRGMNPWPGVFFEYKKEMIKILEADYQDITHNFKPGVIIDNKLTIACGKGLLSIKKVQRPGRNATSAEEFLRGYR